MIQKLQLDISVNACRVALEIDFTTDPPTAGILPLEDGTDYARLCGITVKHEDGTATHEMDVQKLPREALLMWSEELFHFETLRADDPPNPRLAK